MLSVVIVRAGAFGPAFPPARASRPDGGAAALAGADADAVLQRQHEDLAVADGAGLAGAGGVDDRLDGRLDERLVDGDLQLQLRQQPDLHLRAAVHLGVAALPAAAAHVADRHQVDVALVERALHRLKLLGADNGQDHLHGTPIILAGGERENSGPWRVVGRRIHFTETENGLYGVTVYLTGGWFFSFHFPPTPPGPNPTISVK